MPALNSPVAAALAALLVAPAPHAGTPAHPNSLSASRVDLRGPRVVHAIEVQVLSLAEVLPGFDDDLDGRVPPGAIERDAARIADYVAAHYRLSAIDPKGGRPLARVGAAAVREAPLKEGLFGELEQFVRVDLVYDGGAPFARLGLDVDLFVDTSPEHRDLCVVVWNGVELEAFDLAGRERREVAATDEALARARPAFARHVARLAETAPAEWELALLAWLLAVASPSRRTGVLAATTLGLATAAGVCVAPRFVPPGALGPRELRFLTLAAPLALAYVGLDAALARAARARVVEALVFGLVLGARLAARHGHELAREAATEFQPASAVGAATLGLGAGALGLALAGGLVPLGLTPTRRTAAVRAAAGLAALAGGIAFLRLVLR